MRTAWCLGGGGAHGIFQFGMMKYAWSLGHRPDIILGTSVGSLNGYIAATGDLVLGEKLWLGVQNKDIKRLSLLGMFGAQASLYSFDPLKQSLKRFVNREKLRESKTEFYATCTSLSGNCATRYRLTGEGCHPDPAAILHASCSAPIVAPPADGLYDGGLTDNYNVGLAVSLGADHIVMMHPSLPGIRKIGSIIDAIEMTVSLPIWTQYRRELDGILAMPEDKRPKLTVIEPAKPPDFGLFDFEFGKHNRGDLIKIGSDLAKKALGTGLAQTGQLA